ncbi:MAG: hypothetical protein M1839_003831 [Geoglossum umbratile]|nr:MAG: hypothetical protein M1839_003831 [Geoglossum umbratile]
MAPFTIHSRHSWPPGNRSVPFDDPSLDENPFAFYLSPPEDDEIDAGITTPPRSRSRSPFSLTRRRSIIFHDDNEYSSDEDEDTISTVRMASNSPSAVLRRWANVFEKSYPHLSLKVLHGSKASEPDDEQRGRRAPAAIPVVASGSSAQRRRSRSWQPPAVELFTVAEEGDEGCDSGLEEEKARRVREGLRGRKRGRGRGRGRDRAQMARL